MRGEGRGDEEELYHIETLLFDSENQIDRAEWYEPTYPTMAPNEPNALFTKRELVRTTHSVILIVLSSRLLTV